MAYLGIVSMIVFLNALFVYKLRQVYIYSSTAQNRQELIAVVTKSSLLCFASTFTILVSLVFIFMFAAAPSIHVIFFGNLVFNLDVFTNFLSVFLSYNYFDAFYLKLCGGCDALWRRCWSRCCAAKQQQNELAAVVVSTKLAVQQPSNSSCSEDTSMQSADKLQVSSDLVTADTSTELAGPSNSNDSNITV
eukprot:CAMPEP_0202706142 /NCGR_PEP_ID=MMETSP1385-20130828/18606_1 /ASSEMBLY_ACC=CAM_ASM_000861 /TAXON_ID=933848 /ORGANISM="Elphidium margaritaceum" /LENGTH=190 /DNA_ID=CAMNT_0049364543 /DNA_START=451 /DNA_END=1023 /DNA_ORIENTATION=+